MNRNRNRNKMKSTKYILFIVMVLILGMVNIMSASASAIDSVVLDRDTKYVTVKGNVGLAIANQKVTMMVFNASENLPVNIDNVSPETIRNIVTAIGTVKADANGEYVFTFKMEGASGIYKAWIGGDGISSPNETVFEFYSAADIEAAKSAINAAAGDSILLRQKIEFYQKMLGISFSLYDTQGLDKSEVFRLMTGKQYTSVASINQVFRESVLLAMINQAENVDAIISLLQSYGESLDIIMNYQVAANPQNKFLTENQQKMVCSSLLNQAFTTLGHMKQRFYEQIVITAINQNDWSAVNGILEFNQTMLGISMERYNKLKYKSQVDKVMVENTYSDIQAIKSTFIEAVAAQEKAEFEPAQSGGTGGGTGGGKTKTATVNTPPIVEPDMPSVLFVDLGSSEWAKESILYLAKKGIVHGESQAVFNPQGNVTREQFIKMLILGLEIPVNDAQSTFSDISSNAWYYRYIAAAQQLGLTKGREDGTFGVGDEITRQEMAAFAYRFASFASISFENKNTMQGFSDIADVDGYAIKSVQAMQSAGIINGSGNNMFEPHKSCTRAQAAKVVYQILKLAQKVE